MTVVLETYRNECGEIADIQQDKYCSAFTLEICKPIQEGSPFANTILKRNYVSKKSARQAMRNYDKTWKKIFPKEE